MKFLFFAFGVIFCFVCGAYADKNEAVEITESVRSTIGSDLRADYDVIVEKVRAINPGIVENIEVLDLPDDEKISLLRSYLASESFNYYKNKFLFDLKKRAQETGRDIKTDVWDYEDGTVHNLYWLDRGELDAKKCRSDDGYLLCEYPDGFEEFKVAVRETVNKNMSDTDNTYVVQKWLFLDKDVPSEDYSLMCSIKLNMHTNNNYSDDIYTAHLYVSCATKKYSEYHAWRNQEVLDIVAGKYDVVDVIDLPEGSPFGKQLYELRMNKNPDAWKSNKLPGESVSGFIVSVSSSDKQTNNKAK